MQTFLPYAHFNKCAYCLDHRRLGKQRVECKQLLLALGVSVGAHRPTDKRAWQNHPAAKMWRNHELALAIYSAHMCAEWRRRGFQDNLLAEFLDVARRLRTSGMAARYPPWMRDWGVMISHRSNLLRKDKDWYNQFGWLVRPDLPYKWPIP